MLLANGCRVLGLDLDAGKVELARQFGAEAIDLSTGIDPVAAGLAFSGGRGVDAVLITASTRSSDPVHQAARMCRKRGRIVLVGVTGLELNRADFYEKELTFQVSCSYGPGRYDPEYEEKGHDYPFGYVRWTAQRNFEAVLEMMAQGRIDVAPLISYRFRFRDAIQAYQVLKEDKHALGILLQYEKDEERNLQERVVALHPGKKVTPHKPVCGFIGAGNYASRILIPAFVRAGAQLHTIVSQGGVSAAHHGRKHGFIQATTDVNSVLDNNQINTVIIVTRHNSHARYVIEALEAGKHVFVEKPLCLTMDELDHIVKAYNAVLSARPTALNLMVGFNRRFAPQIIRIKKLLEPVKQPKVFIMTMNAGAIPRDSWIQDPGVGGGRIIGEACHYVDLMRYLAGSRIVSVHARRIGEHPALDVTEDKAVITLGFADGSMGTIHYLANGGKVFPKERIEIFAADGVLQLDNFRRLKGYGWPGFKRLNLLRQDKGQAACVAAFLQTIERGEESPIPFDELVEVTKVTIEAAEMLRHQRG